MNNKKEINHVKQENFLFASHADAVVFSPKFFA